MCGIVGIFNLNNDANRKITDEQQAFLINLILTESLYHTEKRGKDATGYYGVFQNGEGIGLKNGKKSTEFIFEDDEDPERCYKEHVRVLENYHTEVSPIAAIIGHCRASTVGSVYDNANNHPIIVDERFVGIHNGTLSNHARIEKQLGNAISRDGNVDSEMLIQLAKVWKAENGNASFDHSTCDWINARIDGPCATFIIDRDDPTKIMWLKITRPVVFYYIPEAGLIAAISEMSIFDKVIEEYNKLVDIYNIDMPTLSFYNTSMFDQHCGIIDIEQQVDVVGKVLAKDIEDMVGDKRLESYKVADFHDSAKNSGYYHNRSSSGYNNNSNFGRNASNSSNNNTDKSDDKENNSNTTNSSTVAPPAIKTNNETGPNKPDNNTENDDKDMTAVLSYNPQTESYSRVFVESEKIVPEFPPNEEIKGRDWPDSLEAIRPLKTCKTSYTVETTFRREFGGSYKSLKAMDELEIVSKVEHICMSKAGELVRSLEAGMQKETESSRKARSRILASKKFINAILPYVNISEVEADVALKSLSDDDKQFLKRLIRKSTLDKSCITMERYVNNMTKEANNYA